MKGTNSNELFGTAREGGNGYGTIFKLTTSASSPVEFSVIYKFTGGVDGSAPDAGLLLGPDGNLYGTTVGPYTSTAGRGVYRVTPSGEFTLLHSFEPGDTQPFAPLMTPGDGSLYGVTNGGSGAFPGRGILYRIAGVFPASTRPFGSFDTPTDGATVAVKYPSPGGRWTTRRSHALSFPAAASGWWECHAGCRGTSGCRGVDRIPGSRNCRRGYMLLSNMLPGGGNGTFTLTATAEDSRAIRPRSASATILCGKRYEHAPVRYNRHANAGGRGLRDCRQFRLGAHAEPCERFRPMARQSRSTSMAQRWAIRLTTCSGPTSPRCSRATPTPTAR